MPAEVPAVPTRFAFPGAPALPALPAATVKTPVVPANENAPLRVSDNLASGGEKAAPPIERKTAKIADPQRPDWIEHPSGREGDIYYETVMVERYTTRAEAEDAGRRTANANPGLSRPLFGAGTRTLFTVPPAFIHDHLVKSRYEETVESSVGPMVNAYARLAFDRRARTQLQRMYRDAQTEHRLLGVAGGAAAVLLMLGSVFGYLKLDTLTRGYYTRRLQFATALVILTVVAGMLLVWRGLCKAQVICPHQRSLRRQCPRCRSTSLGCRRTSWHASRVEAASGLTTSIRHPSAAAAAGAIDSFEPNCCD